MKSRLLTTITFLSLIYFSTSSQVNADSIFQSAVIRSGEGKYSTAIADATTALLNNPNRGDILIFISNNYLWQNQIDSALVYLNLARKTNYTGNDLYDTWLNILTSAKNYSSLLEVCNEAENNKYSNTENILQKKMIAYTALKRYDEALQLIQLPQNSDYLKNETLSSLYTSLLLKRNRNLISANYTLDMFKEALPAQHLASVGYSSKFGNYNLGFRANYANRYGLSGIQLESDLYIQMQNSNYLYLNYGYSFKSVLFPQHRFGIEYYFPVSDKIEASLGGRYLNYLNSNVGILTGHIGKYFGKSWISARPFYVYAFKSTTNTQSFTLVANYRLYGKSEFDFWGLELGLGNSPDEIYSTQTSEFNQLQAYKIKIEKNFMLNRVSDLRIGFGYSNEEYNLNQLRNRFTVDLGYKIRLK